MLWDPQQVRADLESRFGLDDFRAQQILSYPVELMEVRALPCCARAWVFLAVTLGYVGGQVGGPAGAGPAVSTNISSSEGRALPCRLFKRCLFPSTLSFYPASKAVLT